MKEIKSIEFKMADLDEKGQIKFYFAAFDNVDSYRDITRAGAFTKTFAENRSRIKHYLNHDMTKMVGVIKELATDDYGAFAISQLMLKTALGAETYEMYKAGGITEHSYGYNTIKANDIIIDGEKCRELLEVKLWDISSLTMPAANEKASTIAIKSENDQLKAELKAAKEREMALMFFNNLNFIRK